MTLKTDYKIRANIKCNLHLGFTMTIEKLRNLHHVVDL